MNILFDKDSEAQIHDVLGFTDADIDIAKMWPYLRSSSREVFKIIGKDNYAIAENFHKEETGEDVHAELYDLVRYAVAIGAWRQYAPLIDVASTNDGRLFRRDDHQVGGFQWQISENNDALERNYYRAVDELISLIVDSEELDESDYMLQYAGLYVPDLETFETFVPIGNSHLLYFMLAPSLRLCEQREIINRLGTKFTEYRGKKDDMITALVQQCCVYFAMSDGIQKLSVQLFPEGLMKSEKFQKRAATGYDRESVSLYYRNELNVLLKMLETEIKRLNPVYVAPRRINFGENDGFVTTS